MAKIGRPGLSREKKAELWKRWQAGQCASDIAQALERTKGGDSPCLGVQWRNRSSSSPALLGGAGAR